MGPKGDIPDETSIYRWPLPPVAYIIWYKLTLFPWLWALSNCEPFSCLTGSEADTANSVTQEAFLERVHMYRLYIQGF